MRDLSAENVTSTTRRIGYAVFLRLRGALFSWFGFFHNRPQGLTIAKGAIFVNSKGIAIGDGSSFGRFARLETYQNSQDAPRVKIGKNCYFGDFFHISSVNNIIIGDDCLIASKVLIIDFSHGERKSDRLDHPSKRSLISKGHIEIGSRVWICEGVTIFSGARIPNGAIVPAHSFVDGNFDDFK